MLGSLKEKISQIQEGLVGTVKTGLVDETKEISTCTEAGADVLNHYQNCWERIHYGAEQSARQADRCDRLISQVHADYEKQWRHVAMLSCLVGELPAVSKQISKTIDDLNKLEELYNDVELALLTLEETLDARESQERQLQQRFEIARYQEQRRQELQDLEAHLKKQYDKKMKEKERKENSEKLERQTVFQAKFEEDLSTFQSTGFLEVPLARPSEVNLESVNLSEDEGELEAFLEDDSSAFDFKPSTTPRLAELSASSTPYSRSALSRDASMYFTPNETMHDIHSTD